MSNPTNNQLNTYIETHLKHPEWWKVFFEKTKIAEPTIFSTVIGAIKRRLGAKKEIEILGIGAGQGDREIPVLKELIKGGKEISFDYIDIQEEYLKKFIDKLNKEKISKILSQNYIVDWKNFKPEKTYDLILALYCFYGLKENAKEGLQKIFDALKKDGLACVTQSSEEGFIYKLFYEVTGKKPVSAEFLSSQLNILGIDHDIQPIRNAINLGFCVSDNNEKIERDGEIFLSYLLNKDYKFFSKKEKQRINRIINKLVKRGNEYIGCCASNLIIFRK